MGLLDALKISEIKEICRGFAFRRGEEKRILSYKRIGPKFIRQLQAQEIKPSRIFSLLEPLSYEVILALKAKNGDRNIQKHVEDFFEIYNGMRISISGDDLRRLGITPGPYYQKIFSQVLKAKLDKKIKTPEDELALIRKLARSA
jgi:tRNA nucleotidyltransferase (CCA-adding enzyme)